MHHPDQPRAPQKRINDWICFHLELVIGFAMVTIFLASPSAWGLTVSPAAVSFQAVQGSTNPPSQAISLSKSNKRQTTWAATDNAAWLSVSPGTGPLANTAQITIAVNATGLPVGSYSATVTIKTDKAGSASVPVTLTVAPAPASLSSGLTQSTGTNTASLTWSPVASTNLAGYKVYFGTVSGVYGAPLDVGNVTSYMVNNLALGNTFFFVVTSYSTSGVESAHSNEVTKSIY